MNSIIPADLLELKARFEIWRTNRKYARQPIPDELWNAAAGLTRRYPTSLVGRVLKLDPSKLKKLLIKRSARTSVRKKRIASQNEAPSHLSNLSSHLMESRIFLDPITHSLFTQRLAMLIRRIQTSTPKTRKEKPPNDDRLSHTLESNPGSSS